MQKNIKGSILIWSVFLIGFLSFSFLYISLKIQNQLTKNSQVQETSHKNKIIIPNEFLLKKDEEIKFNFLENNSGSLEILYGGPIEYNSGYLLPDQEIFLNNLSGDFFIKNIAGLTKIKFNLSTNSGVTYPYIIEKKYTNIGGVDFLESSQFIYNFKN
ncbi:hypothetical protein H3C61_03990 [Candidatus Gracilibacteria bacterium]|nr:hypothetical protein [Candidatus Gracilibacteria bacterium]